LGDLHGFIVADIPGLIEGASKGKGLGVKFLKHIEKVKIIAHCISLESTDLMGDYETVRSELTAYNPKIAQCTEIIVLTKSDLFTKEEIEIKKNKIKSLKKPNFTVSVLDDAAIKKLSEGLIKHLL
jgi:GTP-binding protein